MLLKVEGKEKEVKNSRLFDSNTNSMEINFEQAQTEG